MKDSGKVKDILGIHIDRRGDIGEMKLSQQSYIENLLKGFNIENCKPLGTPLETNEKFINLNERQSNEEIEMQDKPYRVLVGSLIYLANITRPDIAFAGSALSRFCDKPRVKHQKIRKRVLRNLRKTIDYAITYKIVDRKLDVYVDSNWAGDIQDRCSYFGFTVILANGPVSWSTRKQKCVALSTMEAEYIALSEATKETVYLRRLLYHIKSGDLVSKTTNIFL